MECSKETIGDLKSYPSNIKAFLFFFYTHTLSVWLISLTLGFCSILYITISCMLRSDKKALSFPLEKVVD